MNQDPSLRHEKTLQNQGFLHIAGLDEAGRGPWAGPVVAAAIILPPQIDPKHLKGLKDSKAMTAKQKQTWFELIPQISLQIGTGQASAALIDQIGIVPATKTAMLQALCQLDKCDYILNDGIKFAPKDLKLFPNIAIRFPSLLPNHQTSFIKGEQESFSIAAASVLAKVTRDNLLIKLDSKYPNYGFAKHKGYGTKEHQQALLKYGICPEHRQSFKPIKRLLDLGL
ncbi:MAG TPA: ribonuclease HII [Candidatus Wirthbacteria bacterium]|nr:ribonuclease HII [Candidatus Wirthbacteria bacterium]